MNASLPLFTVPKVLPISAATAATSSMAAISSRNCFSHTLNTRFSRLQGRSLLRRSLFRQKTKISPLQRLFYMLLLKMKLLWPITERWMLSLY